MAYTQEAPVSTAGSTPHQPAPPVDASPTVVIDVRDLTAAAYRHTTDGPVLDVGDTRVRLRILAPNVRVGDPRVRAACDLLWLAVSTWASALDPPPKAPATLW